MLVSKSVFSGTDPSCRYRFLGGYKDEDFLILVNSQKSTEIHLVTPNGSSSVAFSIKTFMDIVSASLSGHKNFIHITERLPSHNGFEFKSSVMRIDTMIKTTDFISACPISSVFLPQKIPETVDVLHFCGNKLMHLRLTSKNGSLHSEKVMCGANFSGVLFFDFVEKTQTLFTLTENQLTLSQFGPRNFVKVINTFQLKQNLYPQLPNDLSLSPHCLSHLPFFRCFSNRIEFIHFNKKICIVEQSFNESLNNLSFSITMLPKYFREEIIIPNTSPNMPISIFQDKSMLMIFVKKHFICVVDISKSPPFIIIDFNKLVCIYKAYNETIKKNDDKNINNNFKENDQNLKKKTNASFRQNNDYNDEEEEEEEDSSRKANSQRINYDDDKLGRFDCDEQIISLPIRNFISSFKHFDINSIEFDYSEAILLLESSFDPKLASLFVSNCLNRDTLISFLVVLQKINNSVQAAIAIHELFIRFSLKTADISKSTKTVEKELKNSKNGLKIIQQISNFDMNFRSASKISRIQTFWSSLLLKSKKSIEKMETAANKIVAVMYSQNLLVSLLDEALIKWSRNSNPNKEWITIINYILVKETTDLNFPKIMTLSNFAPVCPNSELDNFYFPPAPVKGSWLMKKPKIDIASLETIIDGIGQQD
ncbi:hypothetical protein TRFO_38357 [Tritrichomonas foetus]|uniref:Uncharacterized protein n=1 Tax=Tritrichomonas foetus TaxID=1144522 RepID=A0A1J4JCX2_9EUKA|nr:hypothetical protein TRFO_38357 [Tritrichomonas foetus]|eukprot:OHS95515.1 hypothetical protein TRFO_38357 [Tritrichomonas foetus]